jgi:mannosyltransferase
MRGIPVIIYDNVISLIQKNGGATVLFNEIANRLGRDNVPHFIYDYVLNGDKNNRIMLKSRLFERYRDFESQILTKYNQVVFHSTCYRVPDNKIFPVITTVHDFTYEKVIGGLRANIHVWQKSKAIKNSDHLICVSHNTKKDLLVAYPGIDENRVTVIHNGVSDEFGVNGKAEIIPQVLFVGQRVKYKNFISLVEALNKIPDLTLCCVGGGAFTNKEIEILNYFIPHRYKHAGYVDTKQLNDLYNESLCFVYPSLYEGFGIPIIESMKAGCPVVAVNNSSIPEVAGDAAILVKEGSANLIAEAILEMLNANFRSKCVDKGILQASKFSWEKTYSETRSVYERLI